VEQLWRVIGSDARTTSILEEVTFSVPIGSQFTINGPSGSGKSTLLNILRGIDRPRNGRVIFAGQELRALSEGGQAR
jgi:putative ABC transport system ATP-binding protein